MALEEMIARSGPENFERIRQGFIEYPEEARKRRLEEMTLQKGEMELEAAPERQQMEREKFSMEKRQFDMDQRIKDLSVQRVKQQLSQSESEEARKRLEAHYKKMGDHLVAATEYQTPEEKKEYFLRNKAEILLSGDDEEDKSFNSILELEGQQFENAIKAAIKGNKVARDYFLDVEKKKSKGDSEFERVTKEAVEKGLITQEEADNRLNKRSAVLAGTDIRKSTELSVDFRERKERDKKTSDLRGEASKGMEHFNTIAQNISTAFATLDSGDTQMSDTMFASVASQILDTDVKALAMIEKFDPSYGHIAQKAWSAVNRFVTGGRTTTDKELIRQTLTSFRDDHVIPAQKRLRSQYRTMAREEKLDPFKVIPPASPQDIRDATGIDTQEKVRLLKEYFPDMFKAAQ